MIAVGLTGILWMHFCPTPWTPGVMEAQGRGRVPQARRLRWTHLFTSLPAHLYVYASEKASKGGGVTLQAEAQSHDQMRTWGLPQSEVGRTRITSTHLCISLEDSDHQVTSSVSCGNKQGLRYHFIFASSLKLCFS